MVSWLDILMIYVALAIFQLYRDLEAGDNQSVGVAIAIQPTTLRGEY